MKNFFVKTTACIILSILWNTIAFAQSAAPITEAEYIAKPGEVVKGQIIIMNPSDKTQKIVIEKGVVEEADSIKEWITLPDKTYFIDPGKKEIIPYEVHVPESAESKGYYGSLIVESSFVDSPGTLSVSLPHLLLLAIEGNLNENVSLQNFELNNIEEGSYFEFEATFLNKGNVHCAPEGQIELIDTYGESIETFEMNPDQLAILPNTQKVYEVPFESSDLNPGAYRAILTGSTESGMDFGGEVVVEISENRELEVTEESLGYIDVEQLKSAAMKKKQTYQAVCGIVAVFALAAGLAIGVQYCIRRIDRLKKRK